MFKRSAGTGLGFELESVCLHAWLLTMRLFRLSHGTAQPKPGTAYVLSCSIKLN